MEKSTGHVKSEIYSWAKSLIFALIIAFIVRKFLFTPTVVLGESMSSTFENNDKVLINKISDIQRFDIVVFDAPDAHSYYIKRVIGLPGDAVEVRDDVLYINGKAMEEPYLEESKEDNLFAKFTADFTLQELTGETHVPEKSLFVMGDNRINSNDSRFFGFISKDSIIGEVKFRFYPLNNIGVPR
jgi:signal peptidase I